MKNYRRVCKLGGMLLLFALLLMLPVNVTKAAEEDSGMETIVISQSKKEIFMNTLEHYSKRVQADYQRGVNWYYGRSGVSKTFDKAIASGKRKTSCAWLVNWVLRDMKIIKPSETLSSNSKGRFNYKKTKNLKSEITRNFYVINAGNKTAVQLLKSGKLKPGDLCAYNVVTHMNVYIGKDGKGNLLWYDAGRIENGGGYYNARKTRYIYRTFGPIALKNSPSVPKRPNRALKIRTILRMKN